MSSKALCTVAVAFTLSCSSSAPTENPCAGVSGHCVPFVAGASEQSVQDAVAKAKDGDTFAFGTGTFAFTNTLTITNKNVTIKGMGMTATTLDFKGLSNAGSGTGIDALDGSDGFTVHDLAVRDTRKNGIKVKGSQNVAFQKVKVHWTDPDASKHGDYAVYPVFCTHVLVEDSDISGSSDAGIYVGQSKTIVVRRNESHDNVAGVEIENSYDADVYDNDVHDNTGGLLVFDLPGSGNQHDGHHVRLYRNTVKDNNTLNFNATGSVVGKIPAGTGTFVLATRDVEVFQNTYTNNQTSALSVISYYLPEPSYKTTQDPAYNPISRNVWFHDNTFAKNGLQPDVRAQLGLLLNIGLSAHDFPHAQVPDEIWDGIVDPANADPSSPDNPMHICFSNNTPSPDFMNIHADKLMADGSNLAQVLTTDPKANTCQLTPLPEVAF